MKFEYEVKLELNSFEECQNWLSKKGIELSLPITQEDEIFTKPSVDFLNTKKGDEFVRIRKMNNRIQLNRKVQQLNELSNRESECDITNLNDIYSILTVLGFDKIVEVKKTRYKGKVGDYTFCLDKVDKLGSFLELELLLENEPNGDVQLEMQNYAIEEKIPFRKIIDKGYDTLTYMKQNLG